MSATDLATPLLGSTQWAVVDVETTGLSPGADRVLSLAVIHLDAYGQTERVWSTLLNPGCDPAPVDIHGLTRARLAGAPTFEQIADGLIRRLAGRVLVGHNAAFDWQFLASEAALAGVRLPCTHRLCTLALVRRLDLDLPDYKLGTLAKHWNIPHVAAHDALDDARVAARVLQRAALLARESAIPLPLLAVADRVLTNPPVPAYDRSWVNPGVLRCGAPLVQGMRIVITGPTSTSRASLYARGHVAGLDVKNLVNRKASLLVCNDPMSNTGKSRAAVEHGIPVVNEATFLRLLEDVRPGKPVGEPARTPVRRRRISLPLKRSPVGPLAMKRVLVLGGPHAVAATYRERIAAAGGLPAINVTNRVTHAVLLADGRDDRRFARLADMGVVFVQPEDFDSLLVAPEAAPVRQDTPLVFSHGKVADLPVDDRGPQWTVTASWAWGQSAQAEEVDVVALVLDENERVRDDEDFIFYNYPGSAETGAELLVDGPNEQSIRVDLDVLPQWCQRIRIAAALVSPPTFGELGPIQLQVRDRDDNLWATAALDAATTECSLMLADIYRRGDQWRFRAIGQGYDHGLADFATEHGVEVD